MLLRLNYISIFPTVNVTRCKQLTLSEYRQRHQMSPNLTQIFSYIMYMQRDLTQSGKNVFSMVICAHMYLTLCLWLGSNCLLVTLHNTAHNQVCNSSVIKWNFSAFSMKLPWNYLPINTAYVILGGVQFHGHFAEKHYYIIFQNIFPLTSHIKYYHEITQCLQLLIV